ncbi:MAG: riboflavin synthase [Cetobacterium sp.]|uniref:riboflavin synthase n=1 Tax=unclassified Cetobacterium TaxID=2630983 RepID=UPI000646659D|nr:MULTISPECIES: riboflavin synthase [unclassified Cetobacterium]
MFTGLVEELGKIISIEKTSAGANITVSCNKVLTNVKLGDSIATNGVCLTVVETTSSSFTANVMNESLRVSGLNELKIGSLVNLEKSLTLQSYLGGHLVTGDVDCTGKITDICSDGFAKKYTVEIPKEFMKYVVYKGRVTLDGASLTVASLTDTTFTVSLIPHTQKSITLGFKNIGQNINVETDLIGKHLEKLLLSREQNDEKPKSNLSKNFLAENGFF